MPAPPEPIGQSVSRRKSAKPKESLKGKSTFRKAFSDNLEQAQAIDHDGRDP